MDKNLIHWRSGGLLDTDGILVASDAQQEWLLPWWWERYADKNSAPVAFVDLGMSKEKRAWCEAKGEVIVLSVSDKCFSSEKIDKKICQSWEQSYGPAIWKVRKSWFMKPLAFLQTPYRRTIWLDLDCEVLGSVEKLFDSCSPSKIAFVREYGWDGVSAEHQEVIYNSGLVVYERGAELIYQWAKMALSENHRFLGDQQLLSHIIFSQKWKVQELPYIYNWRIAQGALPEAIVVHWVGSWGKNYIKLFGGVKPLFNQLSARKRS